MTAAPRLTASVSEKSLALLKCPSAQGSCLKHMTINTLYALLSWPGMLFSMWLKGRITVPSHDKPLFWMSCCPESLPGLLHLIAQATAIITSWYSAREANFWSPKLVQLSFVSSCPLTISAFFLLLKTVFAQNLLSLVDIFGNRNYFTYLPCYIAHYLKSNTL